VTYVTWHKCNYSRRNRAGGRQSSDVPQPKGDGPHRVRFGLKGLSHRLAHGSRHCRPRLSAAAGCDENVSGFIEDFRQTIPVDKLSVGEVARELSQYFDARVPYREQIKSIPAGIKADLARQGMELLDLKEEPTRVVFHFKNQQGQVQEAVAAPDGLQFILAGYNKDKSSEVYMIYIPGAIDQARDSRKQGKEFGAGWIGQTDVVTRIVLGFDPRLQGIPLVREAAAKIGEPAVQQQLRGVEYSIQWGTMTLQDASTSASWPLRPPLPSSASATACSWTRAT